MKKVPVVIEDPPERRARKNAYSHQPDRKTSCTLSIQKGLAEVVGNN